MAKLVWDAIGERFYGTGVDRGVFYPSVGPGLAWNGLVSVSDTTSAVKTTFLYIDGEKYRSELVLDSFSANIEAYSYPIEFEEYDGSTDIWGAQPRKQFCFTYRTLLGDDTQGTNRGYLIHLVYNCLASPVGSSYSSLGSELDVESFGWDITTKPSMVPDARPSSHLVIDTTKAYPWTVSAIEDILYGTDSSDSRFPSVQEVLDVFEANAILQIINHGDGTWTAIGSDEIVSYIDETTFQIDWPSVVYLDPDTYTVRSL